jgi:hypothetical protein
MGRHGNSHKLDFRRGMQSKRNKRKSQYPKRLRIGVEGAIVQVDIRFRPVDRKPALHLGSWAEQRLDGRWPIRSEEGQDGSRSPQPQKQIAAR